MLVRLDVTHFFLFHRASYCIPAVVYIISDMSSFVVCYVCHPALFVIVAVIMINLVIYPGGCLMKDIHFFFGCILSTYHGDGLGYYVGFIFLVIDSSALIYDLILECAV